MGVFLWLGLHQVCHLSLHWETEAFYTCPEDFFILYDLLIETDLLPHWACSPVQISCLPGIQQKQEKHHENHRLCCQRQGIPTQAPCI